MTSRVAVAWDLVMHLADETDTSVILEVNEGDSIRSQAAIYPEDVKNVVALARNVIEGEDNQEFAGVELRRDEKILYLRKEEGVVTYWYERTDAAGDLPADISVKDFRLLVAELENAADDMREHLERL